VVEKALWKKVHVTVPVRGKLACFWPLVCTPAWHLHCCAIDQGTCQKRYKFSFQSSAVSWFISLDGHASCSTGTRESLTGSFKRSHLSCQRLLWMRL